MVDDKPEATESPPDLNRPKRAPPTIDLQATEISSEPAEQETTASGHPDDAVADSPAGERNATRDESVVSNEPPITSSRPPWIATAIVAALVGALATCGIIGAAAFAGWPKSPAPAAIAPQPDTAQIDALTKRLAKIESQPVPSATTGNTIDTRIAALEQRATTLHNDLAALRAQTDQLAASVNDLKTAPHETTPAPDLSAITSRLSQIEGATRALSAENAQHAAASADDKPLRRVVAMSLLDQRVRQGEPYAAALAAAKQLAINAETLKPLERFEAGGVPSANTLSKELLALITKLTPAEAEPAKGASILDRLQAGAERLVRIRRTDSSDEGGRSAVVNRIAAAARRDDVATARREMNGLTAAQLAALQPWIGRADAREAALAASRQLAADAIAALNKPAP